MYNNRGLLNYIDLIHNYSLESIVELVCERIDSNNRCENWVHERPTFHLLHRAHRYINNVADPPGVLHVFVYDNEQKQ